MDSNVLPLILDPRVARVWMRLVARSEQLPASKRAQYWETMDRLFERLQKPTKSA
jgi:hypothetical protein